MKCPECRREIATPSSQCSFCGHTFDTDIRDKLSFYFELKSQIEGLRSTMDRFSEGLDGTTLRIQQYERLLEHDLETSVKSNAWNAKEEPIDLTEEIPATPPIEVPNTITPAQEIKIIPIAPAKKPEAREFELHVGQKWLLIVGIVTMVFGVGYFLKYSFDRGWIGPAGRVTMAYLWGSVLLVAGDRFRKKEMETFGLYLLGGGIAVLYFATFAGFQIYGLFDQSLAFSLMVLVTMFAGTLSVIYDTKWLAVLGIIGGFLTPVLLSTGQDNQIVLMTYMTILNIGLLGIAFHKRWDLLNILGFVFTYLLYSGWFGSHYQDSKFWPSIMFLNIFFVIYNVIPFAYHFMKTSSDESRGLNIIIPNSIIAFGFSHYMISHHFSLEWVSVITILYAATFLAMATYLYKKEMQEESHFTVLLGMALVFLVITVPMIFSKHWITNFWAAQALALIWMGIRLRKEKIIYGAYALLAVALSKFLLIDYPMVFLLGHEISFTNSYTYLIAERYITSFLLLAVIYKMAAMARVAEISFFPDIKDSAIIFALMGIMAFIVANVEVSAFFHDYLPSARFTATTVLWTLFSVSIMIDGFKYNSALLRKISLGLFLVTIIKVFFFDISKFSTPYRILSFIILGIILIATSFLYYRFKDRISEVIKVEGKG